MFETASLSSSPPANSFFPKNKIRVLLLENIHANAVNSFKREDFQVESLKEALSEEELKEKIKGVHVLGIRSKTKVTKAVLNEANRLLCIGCFCIGTDQVDLDAAETLGIPVFNSPFSNTRSVAELILAEIISLSRRLPDKIREMHSGTWDKSAKNCHEIRGKTLGIVGYGHIGSQLSVMAEAMGMKVLFFDIISKLSLGNARSCDGLESLLRESDFVTLHVPKTAQTHNMITEKEIAMMKKGSYLLNASRGTVVQISALAAALKSEHLAGAAIDVYPSEPEGNINDWKCELQGLSNVIMTPHIGGSTEEAQLAIGVEVADKLIKLVNTGNTLTAVNFPAIDLPFTNEGTHRILNIHKNVPGVLKGINSLLAENNVVAQILSTHKSIGYIILDIEKETSQSLKKEMSALPASLKTRILS